MGMSSNKYTSRGFGASGASQSSWNAPRESYKASSDQGTSFLFGGAGLRGSPKSGSQHRTTPSGNGNTVSAWNSRLNDESGAGASSKENTKSPRGIDLSGGDITTTKLERNLLFLGVLIAAIICSMLVRACVGGTDSSWVDERRSYINPDG